MTPIHPYIAPPPRRRRFTPGMMADAMIGALIVFALPIALLMIG